MRNRYKIFLLLLNFIFIPAFAEPTPHIIVAPHCLLEKSHAYYQVLANTSQFALVSTHDNGVAAFVRAKDDRKTLCGGFMDVTQSFLARKKGVTPVEFLHHYSTPPNIFAPANYRIQYPAQVKQLLKQINPQAMWDNLTRMTQFKDRYANSTLGVEAAAWIRTRIKTIANNHHRNDVSVKIIATPGYKQPSVIAIVGDPATPGIVIGAHMDTLSSGWGAKPGADDDGTGSVTVLETARAIITSGMKFKKPIYFIWYAAEEEGLVGSGAVVDTFKKQHIPIDAVLHFDLTGYDYKNEDTLWLMDDYVNTELVSYISQLITTYVNKPVKHSRCGYACSDHARWTQAGYKAAIPAEASYAHTNPAMHSSQDTLDHLSLTHMTDYLKLATAFAVELAEPA